MSSENYVCLKGRKFEKWIVLEDRGFWCLCRCACGTVDTVRRDRLLRGLSDSCGHCINPTVFPGEESYASGTALKGAENKPPKLQRRRRRRNTKSIIGQQFGKLKVIDEKQNEEGTTLCKCQCECGRIKVVRKCNLISGNTKTCGFHRRNKKIKKSADRIQKAINSADTSLEEIETLSNISFLLPKSMKKEKK